MERLEPRLLLSGYTALQRPTELQYWDASQADNGYNFYGVGGTSYLLDTLLLFAAGGVAIVCATRRRSDQVLLG
jgi:hypothetical protein